MDIRFGNGFPYQWESQGSILGILRIYLHKIELRPVLMKKLVHLLPIFLLVLACSEPQTFDVLIKNGQVVDGSGEPSYLGSVGINADTIAAVGNLENAIGKTEIDAEGLTIAPGFINMLSWATESLLIDGTSESDIRQGVTLEVMGEGWSMGPLNAKMKAESLASQKDYKYSIDWTTLGGYLQSLENRGISCNAASFVGATTLRIHELESENRPPTPEELNRM